jgi:glycerol-3-phosphate dehydrogenase (NAD(P)+)
VEGVYSAKAAKQMAEKYGVETPIIDQVCAILFDGKPAKDAVSDLMLRDKKMESHSQDWER